MNESDDDIVFLLNQWGLWSRGGFGGNAEATIWISDKRSGFSPAISDEAALRIDKAIIAAGASKFVLRHVLERHFKKGIGLIELAVEMRIGRHKLDKLLAEAIGYVRCHLNNFSKAA